MIPTYLTATLWRLTNTLRCCITPNWIIRRRKRCASSLDAGAEYNGYAADLTRTWSAKSDNDYAQLVKDVNDEQLALIATMKAGVSYVDYHIQFHQRIAKLLRKHQIITDMSEEAMVEADLTLPFMPHGIGHPGPAGA